MIQNMQAHVWAFIAWAFMDASGVVPIIFIDDATRKLDIKNWILITHLTLWRNIIVAVSTI